MDSSNSILLYSQLMQDHQRQFSCRDSEATYASEYESKAIDVLERSTPTQSISFFIFSNMLPSFFPSKGSAHRLIKKTTNGTAAQKYSGGLHFSAVVCIHDDPADHAWAMHVIRSIQSR